MAKRKRHRKQNKKARKNCRRNKEITKTKQRKQLEPKLKILSIKQEQDMKKLSK